jgi:TolB protein
VIGHEIVDFEIPDIIDYQIELAHAEHSARWYKDADGDGYSDGLSQISVDRPGPDYYEESELTTTSGDCNDNDYSIHPGANEECDDGIDNNCDGQIDEGCGTPTTNKIAFSSDRDGNYNIYVMNSDGSEQTRLTDNPAADYGCDISPDGTQVVYMSERDGNKELYKINIDATEEVRLTYSPEKDEAPRWSPDGKKILFQRIGVGICTINATDGSELTILRNNGHLPAWSPDGSEIIFQDQSCILTIMDADGSEERSLGIYGVVPDWSPDGKQIVYYKKSTDDKFDIYKVNIDGTGEMNLTNSPGNDYYPRWLPKE